MTHLAVATLHLRGPPALAFRARTKAEEALRLAAPEGERLLVLRRLPLGRLPVAGSARLWEARAGAALRDASGRAVHALSPGAAAAEAVWFASVAEAGWLLLQEMAAGRWPSAWFWRLAVPEWGGATLDVWVPRLVARAIGEPEAEVALARAVLRLAAAGDLAPVARALTAAPSLPAWRARQSTLPVAAQPGIVPATAAAGMAARMLARHPAVARQALLAAIREAPSASDAPRWLARLALVAAAPEAVMQPELLAAMVEAVVTGAASGNVMAVLINAPDIPTTPRARRDEAPPPQAPRATPLRFTPEDEVPRLLRATRAAEARRLDSRPPPRAEEAPAVAAAAIGNEHRSRGAGVLLLVRPLSRMCLPGWLDRHPGLAATGFARALLRHVAHRQRIPPEDALFAMLGEADDHPPALLEAWRVGLDRWLRRRARRRLADVARRPGWLLLTDDTLVARFAADAADLRLRRLALDIDPGWVPWLGLAIRYHFRDTPLP